MSNHTNLEWMILANKDTTAKTTTSPITQASDLKEGEIAIVDLSGARVTNITDAASATTALAAGFKIVKNESGELKFSPVINSSNFKKAYKKAFAPMIRQVSFLGYNGSSGDIVVDNNTYYNLRIRFRENVVGQMDSTLVQSGYMSDSNATSSEIADNQLKNAVLNSNSPTQKPIKVARVGNQSATLTTLGTATIMKFTKGSPIVTAWTTSSGVFAASTVTVAADKYISVPSETINKFTITATAAAGNIYIGTTAYAGTSLATYAAAINLGTQAFAVVNGSAIEITLINQTETLPIFQIVTGTDAIVSATAVSGYGESVATIYKVVTGGSAVASITLDAPYQGETAYAKCGTSQAAFNTGYAGTDPTAFGIKVQAISKNYSPNRKVREGVSFFLEATGYSTTPITDSVYGNVGSGDWGAVTDRYIFAQAAGSNGMQFQNDRFSTILTATKNEAYDMFSILCEGAAEGRFISSTQKIQSNVLVAIPVAAHTVSGDANYDTNAQLTALALV